MLKDSASSTQADCWIWKRLQHRNQIMTMRTAGWWNSMHGFAMICLKNLKHKKYKNLLVEKWLCQLFCPLAAYGFATSNYWRQPLTITAKACKNTNPQLHFDALARCKWPSSPLVTSLLEEKSCQSVVPRILNGRSRASSLGGPQPILPCLRCPSSTQEVYVTTGSAKALLQVDLERAQLENSRDGLSILAVLSTGAKTVAVTLLVQHLVHVLLPNEEAFRDDQLPNAAWTHFHLVQTPPIANG